MASIPVAEEKPNYVLNQPAFFMGCDFIKFMQGCSVRGDYELMASFTYSKSIKKYGIEKVKMFYEKEAFNYRIKLKSIKESNGEYVMHYESNRFATNGIARFNVAIENDSCKLVLPESLSQFGK